MMYSPGSRCVIAKLGGVVVKAPTSVASWRQLKFECGRNALAQSDDFWSQRVVQMRFLSPFAISDRVETPVASDDTSLRDLFSALATRAKAAPSVAFRQVVSLESLAISGVVEKSSRESPYEGQGLWSDHIPVASAHGDFHEGNLFRRNNELQLIDWAGYRTQFWAYFDLVHFAVCRLCRDSGEGWAQLLEDLSLEQLVEPLRVKVALTEDDRARYAVLRSLQELEQDQRLGRLTPRRVEKYRAVLRRSAGFTAL